MKKSYSNIGGIGLVFILTAVCGNIKAQTKTVTGTVTVGENQSPLSGVVVSQEGSDQVTLTNSKGIYQLEITGENSTLLFRHPQYAEKKITANGKTVINLKLDQKEQSIEEVVLNAGYYKVKERESTGSIAKVSAKDIENQPVTNVLSAAQGRMAGVSITQNSGVPGGGFDVQIRGRNSLRNLSNSEIDGNQPLYVIDGVPVGGSMTSLYSASILPTKNINPLNSINPNDIESIEILKDADATAIYGSRGANGVVLVTTKHGKNKRLAFNITTNYGLSRVASKMKMMNTVQYLDMRRQAYLNDGISNYPANAYDINGVWDQSRDTDWSKVLMGNTASSYSTQFSLSGGSETTSFLLSLGHSEQTTVFRDDFRYRTNTLNSNISHRSKDNRFQLNVSNIFSKIDNNLVRQDISRQAYLLAPNSPQLYNADGSLNWENNTYTNPVAMYNSTYSNDNLQFITNINTEYEIINHLKLKLNGGINYNTFEEWALQPNTIYNPATATGQSSAYSRTSKNNQNRFSYILEPQVEWSLKKTKHEITLLAGTSIQNETNRSGSLVGVGFDSNLFMTNISAAKTRTVGDQINSEYRYAALFGRINYQFDKKYFINVTGRRDGSSRFGPQKRFVNFGAVGAAWIISNENFLKDSGWLSFAKLRGSFGTAGSDNIGDYQFLDNYTTSTLIYNNVTGLLPARLFNPDYSWEKTTKLETALELSFLKNRINFTGAWYRNRSSNQLVGIQLPTVTGFSSVLANLDATVENRGFEFELSAKPLSGRDFMWQTDFNISFPKNKLLSFPGLQGSTYANRYVIGESTSIVKLYQYEGIDPATGLYRFKDFNGDGKISSPNDNQIIGNIDVQYFGGWSNTIRYKNWDMSFLFQFVKQDNFNYNRNMLIAGSQSNQPLEVLNVWSATNPNGAYMPYTTGANGTKSALHTYFQSSTESISDASFIRLKNLQIGYSIPLQSDVLRSVKIYLQGQNLLTITNYYGIDPEFVTAGYLPPLRTYSFGAQINF
ncbi:SusC/RagA family protein [Chryseobacterium artocarpi]|uniref:SusC/RagA family protein n=1 Tax=Chryseobacterium artocarpi TaxID=1414727 RepID=A0A1B8ZBV1_9FLAO|nr:SusC/RagA family TonB-linked outer membrane protein [Chryseobacterium artocarpi]OCA69102.1 SusC/RagA family protein [Chryseobacterium artocarpi]